MSSNNELHLLRYIYSYIFWVTNTFRVYLKMGTFAQVHFLWKNCTFTSLLWATHLSLLYLNAIRVKNAYIYSKRAVYFSLGNERCPFTNESILFKGLIKPVGKPANRFANQFEWFVQFPAARAKDNIGYICLHFAEQMEEDPSMCICFVMFRCSVAVVRSFHSSPCQRCIYI